MHYLGQWVFEVIFALLPTIMSFLARGMSGQSIDPADLTTELLVYSFTLNMGTAVAMLGTSTRLSIQNPTPSVIFVILLFMGVIIGFIMGASAFNDATVSIWTSVVLMVIMTPTSYIIRQRFVWQTNR